MVQTPARTELKVSQRLVLGKKVKQLRRQGITPANIFGHGIDSVAVQVPTEELVHLVQRVGRNEIVYLRLGEESASGRRPTLLRHIQRDPLTDRVLHVDFQQISLTEKVRLEVPLHLVGTAPGVIIYGGTLLHSLDYISVEGLPAEVPSHLEVDVSGLGEIDATIHVRDLQVPANLMVITDPELVVAKVAAPAKERVVEEVAEEAAPGEGVAEAVEAEEEAEGAEE